jgi:hypothetical protein
LLIVALSSRVDSMPQPTPVVSVDLYEAGKWARLNAPAACVDYLVPSAYTSYWLHLAVLGNSRSTPRALDADTFEPRRAVARWIESGGLPFAVADVSTLPREVADQVEVVHRIGRAAVITRRGPSSCE